MILAAISHLASKNCSGKASQRPNEGDYYRMLGAPEVAIVLRDGPQIFGHLGLYTREVEIGDETLEIGMLGGIVVAPDRRRRGYSRVLVRHAHERLRSGAFPSQSWLPTNLEYTGQRLQAHAKCDAFYLSRWDIEDFSSSRKHVR